MIKVDEMNSFLSDLMIALFNFDEYELSKKKLKAKINRNSSVVYLPNTKHCKVIDENTGYTKLSAFSLLYVLSLIEPTEENLAMIMNYIIYPRENSIFHDVNRVISKHSDFKNRARHYHLVPKGIYQVISQYKSLFNNLNNDIKFGKCTHRFGKMWTFQDEETKIDIDKKKEMNFVAFCDNFNIIIFIETHDPNADLIIMGNTPWVMNYYFNLKG